VSILGVVIAELSFRLLDLPFGKHLSEVSENALAQFDPELGWSYVPHRSVVQRFGSQQREVAMHFDAFGSRVRAPGEQRNPAAPTVFFVGCSLTMGHGLFYEETVAGLLDSAPEFPWQVVNLAVQGYGTDQALLRLKRHMPGFNTKAVIYGFMCDHLNRNANHDRRLLYPGARFIGTKPMFALRRDGTLFLKRRPQRYDEISYNRLWAYIQIVLARYGPRPTDDLTRALVRDMRAYVESRGAVFIVLSWDGCGKRVLREMDLKTIDVADDLPRKQGKRWKIPGDGHPNAQANLDVKKRVLEGFRRFNLT
jgi:hypothetical protein